MKWFKRVAILVGVPFGLLFVLGLISIAFGLDENDASEVTIKTPKATATPKPERVSERSVEIGRVLYGALLTGERDAITTQCDKIAASVDGKDRELLRGPCLTWIAGNPASAKTLLENALPPAAVSTAVAIYEIDQAGIPRKTSIAATVDALIGTQTP